MLSNSGPLRATKLANLSMIFFNSKSAKTTYFLFELRRRLGVESIGHVMRKCMPRWHGHEERKSDANCMKIGRGEDGGGRQADEDLAAHFVCRHGSAKS